MNIVLRKDVIDDGSIQFDFAMIANKFRMQMVGFFKKWLVSRDASFSFND